MLRCVIICFCLASVNAEESHHTKDFNDYRIVFPTLHHPRTKREIASTKNEDGEHESQVTVTIGMDVEDYVLDLKLNNDLITKNHVIALHHGDKNIETQILNKEDMELCQYLGSIRGKPASWVALSTCQGVSGVIFDGSRMRYIEPAQGNDFMHYLYNDKDLNHTRAIAGEISSLSKNLNNEILDGDNLNQHRYKRAVSVGYPGYADVYSSNKNSRYVELLIVVDNNIFEQNQRNVRKVHNYVKNLVNIIHAIYTPLNIFIALTGVTVWTNKNLIPLNGNSEDVLKDFLDYRLSISTEIPNDNAHLLTAQSFEGNVVGKANKGAMCSCRKSGGIASLHSNTLGVVAATIAHEMGHNFGMDHDDPSCSCPYDKCVMDATSTSIVPMHWSSCSIRSVALSFEKGWDACLRNKPERLFDSSTCGNGFVEQEEQCDCGQLVDVSMRKACQRCCDPTTCMLRANATCGAGACCNLQTCQFRSAGQSCRDPVSECDLPEYCTGDSEYCPEDVYKMDTTPCGDDQAYCMHGLCRSHNSQCQLLWGKGATNGYEWCYKQNYLGTNSGDCGYDFLTKTYMPCPESDVMCGRLSCWTPDKTLKYGHTETITITTYSHTSSEVRSCVKSAVEIGLQLPDFGLVPDGAKCGHDKICFEQSCKPVEIIKQYLNRDYRRDSFCPRNCSGHGVCNSKGNCHCDDGFAPPDCSAPGTGGSLDSGPAGDPKVRVIIMIVIYVIFLGILPLVLIALFLIHRYKPEWLPFCHKFNILSSSIDHTPCKTSNKIHNILNIFTKPKCFDSLKTQKNHTKEVDKKHITIEVVTADKTNNLIDNDRNMKNDKLALIQARALPSPPTAFTTNVMSTENINNSPVNGRILSNNKLAFIQGRPLPEPPSKNEANVNTIKTNNLLEHDRNAQTNNLALLQGKPLLNPTAIKTNNNIRENDKQVTKCNKDPTELKNNTTNILDKKNAGQFQNLVKPNAPPPPVPINNLTKTNISKNITNRPDLANIGHNNKPTAFSNKVDKKTPNNTAVDLNKDIKEHFNVKLKPVKRNDIPRKHEVVRHNENEKGPIRNKSSNVANIQKKFDNLSKK